MCSGLHALISSYAIALAGFGLLACGDNQQPVITLAVYRGSAADFVRVHARSDDQPWNELPPVRTTEYSVEFLFEAYSLYSYVLTCKSPEYATELSQVNSTGGEQKAPVAYCNWSGGPAPTGAVEGVMITPGTVAAGFDQQSHTGANWAFRVPSRPGLTDVVAVTDEKLYVRSNVRVDPSSNIGIVDVARDGVPLSEVNLTINERIGGRISTVATIETRHGTRLPLSYRGDLTVSMPPPGTLANLARIEIDLRASEQDGRERGFRRTLRTTAVEVLPLIDLTALRFPIHEGVSLASLPAIDQAWISVSAEYDSHRRDVTSSPGWLSASGSTRVQFDLPDGVAQEFIAGAERSREVTMMVWDDSGQFDFTSITSR